MAKIRATTYTFDASAKTIDCASFTSLEAIQLITNVTDNIIIYNFADATKGGSLTGTTLTLTYDTTSMSDTDSLQVLVEDGVLSLPDTASGDLAAMRSSLSNVDTNTGSLIDFIHTEDDASLDTESGSGVLAVRQDTPANTSDTDGDYEFLKMSGGRLWASSKIDTELPAGTNLIGKVGIDQTTPGTTNKVSLGSDSVAVTNAGITTIAGAVSGTEMQVDLVGPVPAGTNNIGDVDIASIAAGDNNIGNVDIASIAAGDNNIGNVDVATLPGVAGDVAAGATDSGNPVKVGGKYNSTLPTYTDGQRGDLQIDAKGSLNTRLYAGGIAVNARVDNADGITVTSTANNLSVVNRNYVFNGTSYDRMPGNATDGTLVNLGTNNDVTATGNIAHDTGDSGSPVKVGGHATASVSGETMVAASDRTDFYAGLDGVQIVRPHTNLEDIVSGNASNTDGASTQCIAAGAAGIKTYLTSIILTNTSASNIYVEIKDDTTVKLTIPVPANGGAIVPLPVPLGGTAAKAWNFDPSAAASTVYCSMIGFKSKL